jgi:hypothetical protein
MDTDVVALLDPHFRDISTSIVAVKDSLNAAGSTKADTAHAYAYVLVYPGKPMTS